MIHIDKDLIESSDFFTIKIGKKDGEMFEFSSKFGDLKFIEVTTKDKEYRKGIWDEENVEDNCSS